MREKKKKKKKFVDSCYKYVKNKKNGEKKKECKEMILFLIGKKNSFKNSIEMRKSLFLNFFCLKYFTGKTFSFS